MFPYHIVWPGCVGGHEVLQASDAETALVRARGERPDAILTDCVMPGLDGPTLVERLQADPATRSIPLEASLVRGSHGRAGPEDPKGVFISSESIASLEGAASIAATDVAATLLGPS